MFSDSRRPTLEGALAQLLHGVSRKYLDVHARAGFRWITPYRVTIRTLGLPLLRRVLDMPPLPVPIDSDDAAIHILTKSNEVLFALWACRSLLHGLDTPLPVVLHDDGSLTDRHVRAFETSFPGVRVVRRHDADALARHRLRGLPKCLEFRSNNIMALKLFDPWLVRPAGDVILLDSDILFFRRPTEVTDWLAHPERRQNLWNMETPRNIAKGMAAAPTPQADGPSDGQVAPPAGFNAGLGFLRRDLMNLDRVEGFLPIDDVPPWVQEQQVYGKLSALAGMKPLPRTYHVADGSRPDLDSLVAMHYCGPQRGFFIAEGIPRLLRQSGFRVGTG